MGHQVDHALFEQAYERMFEIRRFEERALALRNDGLIAGSIHLCTGQEAIPVAARLGLSPGDSAVATYRGHGWAIAWGVPLPDVMAEVCQRATGTNGGRGGSPYLSAPDVGFVGENSIVGAGVPIAAGVALASKTTGSEAVTVVSFGDGATSQGATNEAIVMAVARQLPVIFICENNGWSEMTPISAIVPAATLAPRYAGFGLPAHSIDGNDLEAVVDAVSEAAHRARDGAGPTFLECTTHRLAAHYSGDIEHYRPDADRELAVAADPLPRLRLRLISLGIAEERIAALEARAETSVDAAVAAALAAPLPDPATARLHVVGSSSGAPPSALDPAGQDLTYSAALNAALRRELDAREELLVYGEDVAAPGGVFGVTKGLQKEFGAGRVFDTPIAEAAILGSAVGAAISGRRPVVEVMWSDFLLVALDQLANQAANVRYLARGEQTCPLVVRCQQGVTPGSCAQHSQSLEALLAHLPGLKVGLPSCAQDAYGMLRAAIADDDPCVVIESRALYQVRGPVALDGPLEAVGGARVVRPGRHLAILSWGRLVHEATLACEELARDGIDAHLVDLRWLAPLDDDAIAASVAVSGRVLIVHEANLTGGFGAEVAARIADTHFYDLDAPVRRLAAPDVRLPSAPILQEALLPNAATIVAAARGLLRDA